jgi:hypothetical protein
MASRPAALLNPFSVAHLSRIALVATVLGHVVQGGILDYLSVRTGRQTSMISELGAGIPWVPSKFGNFVIFHIKIPPNTVLVILGFPRANF